MRKPILLGLSLLSFSFYIASCGGDAGTKDAGKETSATESSDDDDKKSAENFLSDKAALVKAQEALKALPRFQGKAVNVFQDVHFYGDGRINIELQDPDKPANIDHYEYEDGKWGEPEPVQISGDGDMKDNVTSLDNIKFEVIPTIYQNWTEKAKSVEGVKEPLSHIYFKMVVRDQSKNYWDCSTIDGARESYNITFNLDGSVKEYRKR